MASRGARGAAAGTAAGDGLPLDGVRVTDLCTGPARAVGRFLADLGADVLRVPAAEELDAPDPLSPYREASFGMNVRVAHARPDDVDVDALAAGCDLLVLDTPAGATVGGVDPAELADRHPELVVVSVTDFGRTGPRARWRAGEAVQAALGGVLCRSGLPGRPPLLPPAGLVDGTAAAQAVWAALVAHTARLATGRGELVDVSVNDATVQGFDPGFGIGGSATGGKPAADGPRGRPDARRLYPIFPCADGFVRICMLAPRQWRGMFRWLGEPAEFAGPAFDALGARFAAADVLYPVIGRLFATRTRAEVVAEGERFGVPAIALAAPADVVDQEQFRAASVFTEVERAGGAPVLLPDGMVVVDGRRAGVRPAGTPRDRSAAPGRADAAAGSHRPLRRVRVLDLGVIVVGAETGRLFADMGADVVKVENPAFPDGTRQSHDGSPITPSFACGHRNKRGLAMDLRSDPGRELFERLVVEADVVLSNFKPGTMDSLGLGRARLLELNPRVVVAESSAFGPDGPWSRKMGYGPLVRAATGLSALWSYPGEDAAHCDASTIYPDHVVGRVEAATVLALLLARARTGRGGSVTVAQAEVVLGHLGAALARERAEPGSLRPTGNALPGDAARGLFPCAGDDEWCVVETAGDADWARLAAVLGGAALDPRYARAAARVRHRDVLDGLVAGWTRTRRPEEVMTVLQEAGVPAGAMLRVPELLVDPQLAARRVHREMHHPRIADPVPTENAPAGFRWIPDPPLRPAPMPGEHSREVLADWLAMPSDEIDALVAADVVHLHRADVGAAR